MFVHIFSFVWKADAEAEAKSRAVADIMAFDGKIPGLASVLVGKNVSANSSDYDTTGVMTFANKADFEAYMVHPAHLALLEWLAPLIEALELDFEAKAD